MQDISNVQFSRRLAARHFRIGPAEDSGNIIITSSGDLLSANLAATHEEYNKLPIELFEIALEELEKLTWWDKFKLIFSDYPAPMTVKLKLLRTSNYFWDTKKIVSSDSYQIGCQIITKESIKAVIKEYYSHINNTKHGNKKETSI